MRTEDMIIVSVDDHVVEPPDLFERHLPAKYRDIAPKIVHKDDGTDVWQFLEFEVPNIGLNAVAGRPPEEYGIDPTSFDEIREGCFDIEKRILDMNANGVLGSLNFPSLPGFAGRLFAALEDKEAALTLAQAYNDWHIDEWCGTFPGRFIPLAVPTIWDPETLAGEIHRVAKKDCHAVTFPENPEPLGLPSLHSDHWDPFWKACADEGTIVCMHIGSSSKLVTTAADAPIDVMIVLQPMNIVQAAADLIHSPVFKKFPDVTVALSEGGIGWVPYFLERLDHSYRVHKAWTGADFGSKMPSEVFMEHVVLCFISDAVGARLARDIGVDRITVEIDYPHSDTTWPRAPERLHGEFSAADLADDEIDRMTHLNAMRFFSYEPFQHRPREQCTVGALRAEAAGVDVEPRATAKRPKTEREGPVKITDLSPTA
jgi:predicted TIM-barrel fold metal-dependent hydrolase